MIGEVAAAKAVGALAGAILALVFIPPRTWAGFFQRSAAALIFGFVFGPIARSWGGFDATSEGIAAAAAGSAFASWWIMGAVKRAAEIWQGPKRDE